MKFSKLLEIKFSNFGKLNIEFCFDNSGTAKITKKSEAEINEPKKIKKNMSSKTWLLNVYKKFINN